MAYKSSQEVARLLTDFAEFASEGIVFVDLKGTICFANTAWVKMHGYAASKEITGKNISICHAQQPLAAGLQPFIEEARQNGYFEGLFEHTHKDGSSFQAQVKIIILRASGKEVGYAVFATDLSEYRRFEELLAELNLSNQQLKEQIAELCITEQSLTQDIGKIKTETDKIHNCDVDEEKSEEVSFVREKPLFDPEKFKSLGDLAKRLARKKETSSASVRIPIKELPAVTQQQKSRLFEVVEIIYPPCPTENLFDD